MPTRAPHGLNAHDIVRVVDNATEPVTISNRAPLKKGGVKMVWWFLMHVKSNSDIWDLEEMIFTT